MDTIKNYLKKISIKSLAIAIVFLMFGPEILAGIEFVALIEFIGVDIILLMYLSMVLEFIRGIYCKWVYFERKYSNNCFGTWLSGENILNNISCFFVPERTLVYGYLTFIVGSYGIAVYISTISPILS